MGRLNGSLLPRRYVMGRSILLWLIGAIIMSAATVACFALSFSRSRIAGVNTVLSVD